MVIKRNPQLRAKAAKELVDTGMSKSAVARAFGVDESTIRADLRENPELRSGKSRAHDEKEAEIRDKNAKLKLVKSAPIIGQYSTIVIDPPWEMGKRF